MNPPPLPPAGDRQHRSVHDADGLPALRREGVHHQHGVRSVPRVGPDEEEADAHGARSSWWVSGSNPFGFWVRIQSVTSGLQNSKMIESFLFLTLLIIKKIKQVVFIKTRCNDTWVTSILQQVIASSLLTQTMNKEP